jgi:hypothetical protein
MKLVTTKKEIIAITMIGIRRKQCPILPAKMAVTPRHQTTGWRSVAYFGENISSRRSMKKFQNSFKAKY